MRAGGSAALDSASDGLPGLRPPRVDRAPREARASSSASTAEVDPDLEITEIVDRTVKAKGPALLFENVKGSQAAAPDQPVRHRARACACAFGVERLDEVGEKLEAVLEMQPPQGLVDKVRSLGRLKSIADSMPKEVGKGRCQEIVLTGDDVDLDLLPIQRCWPGDPAPVHHPARRDHEGRRRRACATSACTGCRRTTVARPSCTGRSTRTAAPTSWRRPMAGSPSRSRSGSTPSPRTPRARRCRRRSASSWSPASSRARLSSSSSARRSTCRCRRNAEIVLEGWVDRERRRRRGPVRRPHGLLHAARGVPDLPDLGDDHARGRDLPVDRRRAGRPPRTSGSRRRPSASSSPRSA